MAFIKEESEDVWIEETFRVKQEDAQEQTDVPKSCPAKLRVILQDHDIRKLDLPHGIPGTVSELESIMRKTFGLNGNFTLHYKDADFGEEYFSLTSTSEIKDKDTIKINEEFERITTVNLETTFMAKLDQYSPKIMSLVFSRGRSSKMSIQRIKNMLLEDYSVEGRREAAIRSLVVFLRENEEDLFKEHLDDGDIANEVMKIIITRDDEEEEKTEGYDSQDEEYVARLCI
ncbi:hypothetical protein cypCar_00039205, partial [Cyprinus carpio]